jgi:hypothetical protein
MTKRVGNVEALPNKGKWGRADVPHDGWVCTYMYDMKDMPFTCGMCETAGVLYMHVMENPKWKGSLHVDCDCAGRMEGDPTEAARREEECKASLFAKARRAAEERREAEWKAGEPEREASLPKLAAMRAERKTRAEVALASGVVVPFPLVLTDERLVNAREKGSLDAAGLLLQTLRQVAAERKGDVR